MSNQTGMSAGDHLTEFYVTWLEEEGLPDLSAEDLLHEYDSLFTGNQLEVLNSFIKLWEAIYN